MLRASRAHAALIRSLVLGTAAVTTTVITSSVLVGCKNENQPEYWLDKLEDPKWRPRAVKRLTQFLDDALSRANGDMKDPVVVELENKLVLPLTDSYVKNYGELDTATRVHLVKLLADFRDERAIPAFKTAFEEFAKRPRKTTDEADIKWTVRAYGDMKSKELAPAVLQAFVKLQAHTQLGGIVYRDYNEAMVEAPQPEWASTLIDLLAEEMKDPNRAKTKEQAQDMIEPFRDQQFWQMTSAQVLGELRDPNAVEPLLKVLLTPSKSSIATTALLALVKIGKPAVDRAIKMLDENDPLVKFHIDEVKKATDSKEDIKGNPALPIAAAVIGLAGHNSGIDPLVKVLESNISEDQKAIAARELTKIPATPASKEAFKKAFESISLDTSIQGTPALMILAEAAGQFYDSDLVDWLLDRAEKTKGSGEEKTALQQSLVMTALKVAKPDQWSKVSAAATKYKMDDLVKGANTVVETCKNDVKCYVEQIEKSENQTQANQLAGIKAGYMIGVLGDAEARDALVDALDGIENASIRFVAAQTIDKLTPQGDSGVVEKLNAIISKNKKSADANKALGDQPLQQVAYRITARGN